MSEFPDADATYVSKATFLHLWGKLKGYEDAIYQADTINSNLAGNVLRLGDECRDYGNQVTALKAELARVMEDLHTANDALASLRSDHKWLMACHKTHTTATREQMVKLVDIQMRIFINHPGILALNKDFSALNDLISEIQEGLNNGK